MIVWIGVVLVVSCMVCPTFGFFYGLSVMDVKLGSIEVVFSLN